MSRHLIFFFFQSVLITVTAQSLEKAGQNFKHLWILSHSLSLRTEGCFLSPQFKNPSRWMSKTGRTEGPLLPLENILFNYNIIS